ncbi:hypothetical protein SAY86_027226 [Trapa natans]|uniref:Uncharacterized protein n=1 Tax=Trapa natans TaxID=22666 RepID=A0AAN7KKY9_TRANT|nr:hypothetical protein SAY86_027226 [Trapa natans]
MAGPPPGIRIASGPLQYHGAGNQFSPVLQVRGLCLFLKMEYRSHVSPTHQEMEKEGEKRGGIFICEGDHKNTGGCAEPEALTEGRGAILARTSHHLLIHPHQKYSKPDLLLGLLIDYRREFSWLV